MQVWSWPYTGFYIVSGPIMLGLEGMIWFDLLILESGTEAGEAKWLRLRWMEATNGQRLKGRKVCRRTPCILRVEVEAGSRADCHCLASYL